MALLEANWSYTDDNGVRQTGRKGFPGKNDSSTANDKITVFQQCVSAFNQNQLSSMKARRLLTQLVRLFYLGESFPESEASQLFFTISKLFQKENPGLRQIVYLAIKELCPFTDNVIMGTSVLMKDVQSSHDQIYRPNALRTLCRILDASSVEGVDRLMRTAIVDSDPTMSSAALVSAYNLLSIAQDTVRHWATETQEALSGAKQAGRGSGISQYHALGLLYHMRSHDRMGLVKMIQQLNSGTMLRNPQAVVLLIRFIGQILEESVGNDVKLRTPLLSMLTGYLRHRSDMANLEAAKIILGLRSVSAEEAAPAIQVLQAYLGSPRAPSRFSAIRSLNRYASLDSAAVSVCNNEIEALISDPNRAIATYAITALLKTGSEDSVERLIEQISTYMDEIDDDFRVVVIDAIRNLAVRFPNKHERMLSFFSEQLRLEGGLSLKMAIVEAIADIVHTYDTHNSDAMGQALIYLCECIEDCEYPEVTVRVLHILGAVGPTAAGAASYVRYIYNRVVLENSVVRAAAVSALTRFAQLSSDEDLRASVRVLLKRCLSDSNDEVRDRASLALSPASVPLPKQKLELAQLESSLLKYMSDPSQFATAFNVSHIQRISDEERMKARSNAKPPVEDEVPVDASGASSVEGLAGAGVKSGKSAAAAAIDTTAEYAARLREIPETEDYGKLLKSSTTPLALTDVEMEYVVNAIVHVYTQHIVLQLDVHNTYDCILEDVQAAIDTDDVEDQLEVEFIAPIEKLVKDETGTVYIGLSRKCPIVVGSLSTSLRFIFKELEEDDGQEEEYGMDALEITVGDYMIPTYVGSFNHQFDELPAESTTTRQLSQCRDIKDAVSYLTTRLGMMALEDGLQPEANSSTHSLKLFGKTVNGVSVAASVRLLKSARAGVAGKLVIRSSDADVAETVSAAI